MADEIKDAVKVSGGKYFFYKKPDDVWRGTLEKQNFWSRTFFPPNTEIKEADTKELLVNILKTDKVPLTKDALDEETVKELEVQKVPIDVKPIDIKPIDDKTIIK
jgi:hypothetical protein